MKARFQCYRAERQLVRWRLLGGNNRVLGVSTHAYPDEVSCVAAVDTVRARLAEAAFELEPVAAVLWVWRMIVPDGESDAPALRSLATAGHGFARRVEAVLAAERFRERAGTASLNAGIAMFGTRRAAG